MKGLLLKDFYMLVKYCRAFLLILAVFLAVSCFGEGNAFFVIYPTLIAGLIPVTLISYDEREKWNIYSAALPYTKAQLVSSKYLIGLLFELLIFLFSAGAQAFRMWSAGAFAWGEYLSFLLAILVVGMIGPSLLLPFIFRFGAEKGRIAYYIVIGALCAAGTIAMGAGFNVSAYSDTAWPVVVIAAGAVLLYALSWVLSILFYRKREL